jgi:hypothetical protein
MKSKYGGLTVNERLYIGGLTSQFDKALLKKDGKKLASILKKVDLNIDNIEEILKFHNLTIEDKA